MFRGRCALITGGLGFIGSTLARRLVALDANVTIVDSLLPQYGGNVFNITGIEDRVHLSVSDLRDEEGLPNLVRSQDLIFDLAGQSSHLDSMDDPFADLDVNCRARLAVLEACRRHNPGVRLVFASTRQVYGRPKRLPVDEHHPLDPVDINGVNKLAGEWYHLLYDRVHGLTATILRITNTYGPRMRVRDARQTFLGLWIRLLVQGRTFEVWDGSQVRDLAYVDDVVDALLLAATEPAARGEVFNVGGPSTIALRELAELLVRINGGGRFSVRSFPRDRKLIDVGDVVVDSAKIASALGWRPATSLEEGLRRTIDFYREHGDRYFDGANDETRG